MSLFSHLDKRVQDRPGLGISAGACSALPSFFIQNLTKQRYIKLFLQALLGSLKSELG